PPPPPFPYTTLFRSRTRRGTRRARSRPVAPLAGVSRSPDVGIARRRGPTQHDPRPWIPWPPAREPRQRRQELRRLGGQLFPSQQIGRASCRERLRVC